MTQVSSTVFTLRNLAYDPDVLGGISHYTLENAGPFYLDGALSEGHVVLRDRVDYDAGESTYVINVTAVDYGSPAPLQSSTSLIIHIADSDDLIPLFTQDVYTLHLPEEDITIVNKTFSSTPVLVAYDGDRGINTTVGYRIVAGHVIDGVEYFAINTTTGEIVPLQVLDRETTDMFDLLIKAYQTNNQISRVAMARMTVVVDDVNDNAPIMLQSSYNVTIEEHLLEGSRICQVSASDKDQGNNSMLHYALVDSSGALDINSSTGVIFVADRLKLDREIMESITVGVYATETLTQEKYTSNISYLLISLTDINDNSPIFLSDDVIYKRVETLLSPNTTIVWVNATDSDEGSNGQIRYSLIYTSDIDLFAVDIVTGRVYNTDTINTNQDVVIVIVIQAEDQPLVVSERRSDICVIELTISASSTTKSQTITPYTTYENTISTTQTQRASVVTESSTALSTHQPTTSFEDVSSTTVGKVANVLTTDIDVGQLTGLTVEVTQKQATHDDSMTSVQSNHVTTQPNEGTKSGKTDVTIAASWDVRVTITSSSDVSSHVTRQRAYSTESSTDDVKTDAGRTQSSGAHIRITSPSEVSDHVTKQHGHSTYSAGNDVTTSDDRRQSSDRHLMLTSATDITNHVTAQRTYSTDEFVGRTTAPSEHSLHSATTHYDVTPTNTISDVSVSSVLTGNLAVINITSSYSQTSPGGASSPPDINHPPDGSTSSLPVATITYPESTCENYPQMSSAEVGFIATVSVLSVILLALILILIAIVCKIRQLKSSGKITIERCTQRNTEDNTNLITQDEL